MRRSIVVLLVVLALSGCAVPVPQPPPAAGDGASAPADSTVQASFQLSLAYTSREDLSNYQSMADRIYERSDGRLSIALYPNGILGNERELIWGVQHGTISMVSSSLSDHVEFVPQAAIADIPACFSEYLMPFTVYDGTFLTALGRSYAQAGMELICLDTGNAKVLSSQTPVTDLEDLASLSVRIPDNPFHRSFWQTLQAVPTSGIAYSALYNALQAGAVDAQENSLRVIWDPRLYEVQQYILDLPLFITTRALVMNQDAYAALPQDLQQILREEALVEAYGQQQLLQTIDREVTQGLAQTDIQMTALSQQEIALLRQTVEPVLHAIQIEVGDALLDALIQETREKR